MPYDAMSTSEADTTRLIDDVVEVCLHWRIGQWACPWLDVVKALRHHRWAFYRPRRQWTFRDDDRDKLLERLIKIGFVYQDNYLIMTKAIKKPKPRTRQAAQALLDINPDIDPEELLEMLKKSEDSSEKKRIRTKLRSMGHRGGLRNE